MIVQSNNCYQFVEDYVFSSPSTAGGVILGRATNGWTKTALTGKSTRSCARQA